MKKFITALALATLAGSVQASGTAVSINFDSTLPTYFNTLTHQENGFTLTSNTPNSTLIDNNNLVRSNLGVFSGGTNSQSLFWGENDAVSTLSLAQDSGLRFDLLSFDASSLYNAAGVLTLTGTTAWGGTVQQVLNLSGTAISTYNFSGMTSLVSLDITYDGIGLSAPFDLDNINMSAVPVPAAVWLFGSGLAALIGWSRRRATIS